MYEAKHIMVWYREADCSLFTYITSGFPITSLWISSGVLRPCRKLGIENQIGRFGRVAKKQCTNQCSSLGGTGEHALWMM